MKIKKHPGIKHFISRKSSFLRESSEKIREESLKYFMKEKIPDEFLEDFLNCKQFPNGISVETIQEFLERI